MKKFGKALLVLLLSVFITTLFLANGFSLFGQSNVWDGTVASYFKGEGTEENPYIITTAEELALLSQNVRYGQSYDDCYFELGADIVLNDSTNWQEWGSINEEGHVIAPVNTWTPIGLYDNYGFKGYFDGKNHTISGMYVNNINGKHFGLFGYAYNYDYNIKNLIVKNSYVFGKNTHEDDYYDAKVGGIVGYGNAENCHFSGTVVGDVGHTYMVNIGGVVGYGAASNCTTQGKVYAVEKEYTTSYVGGIIGRSIFEETLNCKNYAEVKGTYVGGITAYGDASYCENYGSLYAKSGKVGGITGEGRTLYCKNSGNITAEYCDYVGGVVADGNVYNATSDDIINYCFNEGTITATNCVNVGGVSAVGIVWESYNAGTINASGCTYVGGINASTGEVASYGTNKCYNAGIINADACSFVAATVCENENENLINYVYYIDTAYPTDEFGTKLTDKQMRNKTNFAYFNFNKVWEYVDDAEYPYPTLRYFGSKIYGYGVDLYDGETLISSQTVVENSPYIFRNLDDKGDLKFYAFECDGKHYFDGDSILIERDTVINAVWQAKNKGTGVWDGSVDTEWQGTGSESDPYLITSAAELAGLAQKVNTGETYSKKFFSLKSDIRLNTSYDFGYFLVAENIWDPIGNYIDVVENTSVLYTPEFRGTFNGNGHTVYGLYINSSNHYLGLFGYMGEGSINDLVIKDSYICVLPSETGYTYAGSVVGYGRNVSGCTSYAVVEYSARGQRKNYNTYIGGVLGHASNVSQCENYGNLTLFGREDRTDINVGFFNMAGVAGNATYIDNSKNYGKIEIKNYHVDGNYAEINLSGVSGDSSTVTDCENHGEITSCRVQVTETLSDYVNVSGITFEASSITNCINTARISSNGKSAGIVNWARTIDNCTNTGDISGGEAFGICSRTYDIINCVNEANLSAACKNNSVRAAGIAGEAESAIGCTNKGKIDAFFNNEKRDWGEIFASGLIINLNGQANSTKNYLVQRCQNLGNVTANVFDAQNTSSFQIAGIVCSATGEYTIDQCYNGGEIYARNLTSSYYQDSFVGGIAGKADVKNSYNSALITVIVPNGNSEYSIGGIAGMGSAENCYNVGTIRVDIDGDGEEVTVGGVVGASNNNETVGSYYLDTCLSGAAKFNTIGISKTDAQLRSKSTFTGYDFNKHWEMGGVNNYPYPNLRFVGSGKHQYFITIKDFGNTVSTEMYLGGSVLTFEAPIAKSGYTFAYFENEKGQFKVGDTYTVDGDLTFTAVWIKHNTSEAWDKSVITEFKGSGTEADPYLIENAAQLAGLANLINENRDSEYATAYYKQTKDIYINSAFNYSTTVLTENSWTPIGTNSTYAFKGTFDGNGFTIYGLYFKDNSQYKGLFGYAEDATFKNVNLKNGYLVHTSENNYTANMGALLARGKRITVSDSKNYVNILSCKYDDTAGGLVGMTDGITVENCENYGSLSAQRVGGIVGNIAVQNGETVTINNSKNYGKIVNTDIDYGVSGGIVAYVDNDRMESYTAYFENCLNEGEIYAKRGYTGGILGYSNGATEIKNCENKGYIHGSAVGGIVSCIGGEYYSSVKGCKNQGIIAGEVKEDNTVESLASGIVAFAQFSNYLTVSDCENFGEVKSFSTAGGIVGAAEGVYIHDCTNHGNITCLSAEGYSTSLGGIAGRTKRTISNCVNNGTVMGLNYAGGIAGQSASVNNCTNNGNVTAHVAGGISGKTNSQYYAYIEKCINNADVNGSEYAGGIVGDLDNSGDTIISCENMGTITCTGYGAGGIVATCAGNITKCSNIGTIKGDCYYVGGISGNGDVTLSYNKGNVIGKYSYVGGIVGNGSASDCFNVSTVEGNDYVGGIAGVGDVLRCYVLGDIKSKGNAAYITDDNATDCYYNATVTIENGYREPTLNGTYITTDDLIIGNMPGFDFEKVWQLSTDEEYPYPTLRDTVYYVTYTVTFLDSDGQTVLKEQKVRKGSSAYPPTIEPFTDENYVYAVDHWEGSYQNIQKATSVKAVYKKTEKIKFIGRTFSISVPFGYSKDNLAAKIESQYRRIVATTTHGYKMNLETEFDLSGYELNKSGEFIFSGKAVITESPYYEMAEGESFKIIVTVNSALDNEFDVADLTYTESNGKITITGYNGLAEEIRIPETINGKAVIKIGENAFKDNQNITSVYLPDSIEEIGESAFNNTVNLVTVSLGKNLRIIGANAFCNTSLGSITLYEGVETIGENAFGIYEDEVIKQFTVYCLRDSVAENYAKEKGLGVSYIEIQTSETTGISATVCEGVTLNASKVVGGDYYETAQSITEKANVSLFEITLSSEDGTDVQPDNMMTVSIPLPEGYGKEAKIYRINSDGSYLDMNAICKDGKLVFSTAHLSYYAIVSRDSAVIGDANGDGIFNTTDLAELKLFLAGVNGEISKDVDLNGDGAINTTDLAEMKLMLAGVK